MVRVMMEQCQLFGIGGPAKPNAFLPRRMPPPDFLREFLVSVGTVIDHQISILDKIKNDLIGIVGIMFGIGDITN